MRKEPSLDRAPSPPISQPISQPSTPPITQQIAQPLAKYSAWRRAGDLVFLSGVIAVDPSTATIVKGYADIPPEARKLLGETGEFSTDIKEGPILAQSWFVLDRILGTVEAAGGQMSDVIKLVQYFKNLDTSRTTAACASCFSTANRQRPPWWR